MNVNEVENGDTSSVNMLIDTTTEYAEAYGMDIYVGVKEYLTIKDIKNINAKHKAEVRVVFNGTIKEFTFTEFINLLGFPFNDEGLE